MEDAKVSNSTTPMQQRLLLLIALVPLFWSAIAAVWTATPQIVAQAEPLPSLAFEQYLVNQGDVGLAAVVGAEYHFTNTGTEPLTITKLDPSCGCLRPRLMLDEDNQEKMTYQPGESGYFVVSVATANEVPGPHTYTVDVDYNDPQPRQSKVRFKLHLPEKKVTVNPPELAFFQYNGQPSEATVYVTDYRGHDIAVTGVESTSEVIEAEIRETEVDEYGNPRVPVVLHVPGIVPAGRALRTLTIRTNDPEFSVIQIPILVDGPEIAPVSASVDATGPPPPHTP